jgi:hypothetical protein
MAKSKPEPVSLVPLAPGCIGVFIKGCILISVLSLQWNEYTLICFKLTYHYRHQKPANNCCTLPQNRLSWIRSFLRIRNVGINSGAVHKSANNYYTLAGPPRESSGPGAPTFSGPRGLILEFAYHSGSQIHKQRTHFRTLDLITFAGYSNIIKNNPCSTESGPPGPFRAQVICTRFPPLSSALHTWWREMWHKMQLQNTSAIFSF